MATPPGRHPEPETYQTTKMENPRYIGNIGFEAELYRGRGTGLIVKAEWRDTSGGNANGYSYRLVLRTSCVGMFRPTLPDGRNLDVVLDEFPAPLDTQICWNAERTHFRTAVEAEQVAETIAAMREYIATLPLDLVESAGPWLDDEDSDHAAA